MKIFLTLVVIAVVGVGVHALEYPAWMRIPWVELLFAGVLVVVMGMGVVHLLSVDR